MGKPGHGKLYLGLASHNDNPCVRGAVFALDPKDGHSIWAYYTVDANHLGGTQG
jgi:hypothetical protein